MASFLDIGIVKFLTPVFVFLFIFALCYAVLDKFKLMGGNTLIRAVISFAVAMLFLFSDPAMELVKFLTPWFLIFVLVGFFIVALFLFLGVRGESMTKALENPTVFWIILILVIVLLLVAVSKVFSGAVSPYAGEEGKNPISEGIKAIVHPRVLGALFLLIIAAFAVRFIGANIT